MSLMYLICDLMISDKSSRSLEPSCDGHSYSVHVVFHDTPHRWGELGMKLMPLGASWRSLGWGLGRLFGGLGSAWVALGRFRLNKVQQGATRSNKVRRPVDLEGQKALKLAPQIGPKTEQNRRQEQRRKKKLLKIVLGPSWADLVPHRSPKSCSRSSQGCCVQG